jgi:magnesium-transporting ATPase (P-type)
LIKFCQPLLDLETARKTDAVFKYSKDDGKEVECLIPFNSEIKFNLVIRKSSKTGNLVVYMKGAPERIINRCTQILISGEEVPIKENQFLELVQKANATFGNRGERVLAFARLELE